MDDERQMTGGDPNSLVPEGTSQSARLTRKQRAFVEHYLRSWNATRAAEAAGYAHARQAGSRMLSNADIQAAVHDRLAELAMQADEVLYRLAEMARANIYDFIELDRDGRMVGLNERALEERGYLVKKVTTSEGKTSSVGIELYDAQAALVQIGKHLGIFAKDTGDVIVNVNVTSDDMAQARSRARALEEELLGG